MKWCNMWQFDIISSANTSARSGQDYLNMIAIEESKTLNGRGHGNRFVHLLKRVVFHTRA